MTYPIPVPLEVRLLSAAVVLAWAAIFFATLTALYRAWKD